MKTYELRENHIILFIDGVETENLTENAVECRYCKYQPSTCRGNGIGAGCDWFTSTIPEAIFP